MSETMVDARAEDGDSFPLAGSSADDLGPVLDAIPLGIVLVQGEDARAVFANEQAVALFGRPVLGSRAEERCSWFRRVDGGPYGPDEIPGARALRGEPVASHEMIVARPGGRAQHVEVQALPLQGPTGEVERAVLTIRDVTRRRRAEDRLVEKLAELEGALAALPDAYFRLDATHTILDARAGRTARWNVEPLIGRQLGEAFEPEVHARIASALAQVRETRTLATVEYAEGSGDATRWHEVRILPIASGELVLVVRDVTDLERARQRLVRSLEEKDVLLKEIHHRVKNNLQMISSLLRLQSQKSTSTEVREMFKDSQARIRAMALIHDRLYQSENVASVDFGAHLRELATMLVRLFARPGCEIRINVAVDPVSLHLDTAVPLGLVANELITNALKHGLAGRAVGTIDVALVRREAALSLTVSDDGVGFPPDLAIESTPSLGLRMVRLLTDQLHGALAAERSAKSTVSVTIPFGEMP